MSDIHFGTDGWRARIAEDFTFDNVRRVAQGFADYLKAIYPAELSRGAVVGGGHLEIRRMIGRPKWRQAAARAAG